MLACSVVQTHQGQQDELPPWAATLTVHCASCSQGNINVIEAAAAKGVKKFVLITSIGCGDTKDAPGEQVKIVTSAAVSDVTGQAMRAQLRDALLAQLSIDSSCRYALPAAGGGGMP
jgi:nucleoside-diphosphate-sugar epimerase